MNLTVYYFGQIGQAAGRSRESIPCSDSMSLQQLLQKVVEVHGESVRPFVFDSSGQPSKSLVVTVNDTMVNSVSASALQAGDEVALLPPIAGG